MGWAFVKRRMMAELGPDWQKKFASFEHQPAAAASLGQVHRARAHRRRARSPASCNIPTCSRRSRPTCSSCEWLFAIHRRMDPAIDTSEIGKEIGARVREELDYRREAKHVALYRTHARRTCRHGARAARLAGTVDRPAAHARLARGHAACSRTRTIALEARNRIATAMFTAWWYPFSRFGVIHGDPHLGNYTVFERRRRKARRHQSARLRLHPHFPAEIRRRRGRSLSRAAARRRRPRRARLRDLGLPQAVARTDRHAQHLGALHLRRRCSTIACAPSPTAWRRANTAGAKPSGCIRRSRQRAR